MEQAAQANPALRSQRCGSRPDAARRRADPAVRCRRRLDQDAVFHQRVTALDIRIKALLQEEKARASSLSSGNSKPVVTNVTANFANPSWRMSTTRKTPFNDLF